MLQWVKSFLKEHYKRIIATVTSSLIVAVFLGIFARAPIKAFFLAIANWLIREYNCPTYFLISLFLAGLLLPVLLKFIFKKKNSINDYVRDEVGGLVWEWDNWNFDSTLTVLCPRCLAELSVRGDHQGKYICVSCNYVKEYKKGHCDRQKVVKIEIEKRRRTNEWKKADMRVRNIQKATK